MISEWGFLFDEVPAREAGMNIAIPLIYASPSAIFFRVSGYLLSKGLPNRTQNSTTKPNQNSLRAINRKGSIAGAFPYTVSYDHNTTSREPL